jgi:hypothetical protein
VEIYKIRIFGGRQWCSIHIKFRRNLSDISRDKTCVRLKRGTDACMLHIVQTATIRPGSPFHNSTLRLQYRVSGGKNVITPTKYFKPPQTNDTKYEGCRLFIDFRVYCLRVPVHWEPSQIKPPPTLLKAAAAPPGYRVNMPAALCITTPTH